MSQRPARFVAFSVLTGAMLIFSGTFGEAFAATHGVHPPIAKTACSVRPGVTTAAYAHVVNGQSAALDSKTSVRLTGDPASRPPKHHKPAKHTWRQ